MVIALENVRVNTKADSNIDEFSVLATFSTLKNNLF